VKPDPIQRGARWRAFFDEDGGLKDMLVEIQATYLERLAAVDPANVSQLQVLAMAHRISKEFEAMIRAVIAGGEVAQAAKEYATRMQAIPEAARRYM
jgi:hypothetical protein